eukprot:gene35159-39769_t
MGQAEVEVRRSKRRRRTVSAYRDGDRIVVLIPATLTRREEAEWVETMVERIERSEQRRQLSDEDLRDRAWRLSNDYLGGLAVPESVRWVDNQNSRWGSCTPGHRSIRLSVRLQGMPGWVIDYVLVQELAHLLEAGHDAAFWGWVERYPQADKARGFLEGWSAAVKMEPPPGDAGEPQGHQLDEVGVRVGERVDGPPAHGERLVADLVVGVGRCDGHEAHVQVVHGTTGSRPAEGHGVLAQLDRDRVEDEVGETGLLGRLPQRGPGERGGARLAVAAELDPAPRLGVP